MESPLDQLYRQEELIVKHMVELQTFYTTPQIIIKDGKRIDPGYKWNNKEAEELFIKTGEALCHLKKQIHEFKMQEREEYERRIKY